MAESFRFYVLGLCYFVVGLLAVICGLLGGAVLILALPGAAMVVLGAALMEGVTWRDLKEYVRPLFH